MDMRRTHESASGAVGDTSMESGDYWRSYLPDTTELNSSVNSVKPSYPGSQEMQQENSQQQTLSIPVYSNHLQPGQQLLSQTLQNNICLTGMQASLDSTAQTSNANGGDWQEEIYQKFTAMTDLYLLDLNDLHQNLVDKSHQNITEDFAVQNITEDFLVHNGSLLEQLTNEYLEKLRGFKNILEHSMAFLETPKRNILADHIDKLSTCEKQIIHIISKRRQPAATQHPPPPPHMHSVQIPQKTHLQVASTGSRKSNATDQSLEHLNLADHFFAPKILFFMECFLTILFLCYINTVAFYVVFA